MPTINKHIISKVLKKKIKNSKPFIAELHTNEMVIPVKYTDIVRQFLKKKNIRLPK